MSASLPDESLAFADLARLAEGDETRAKDAFGRLWARSKEFAVGTLVRRGVDGVTAQDIAQSAFVRLWETRSSVGARTIGEWYALVRRRVLWALHDHLGRTPDLPLDEEVATEDLPYLDALIVAREEGRDLYAAADGLWLGETDAPDAELRAAAVQLVLLEGMSVAEVATMYGREGAEVEAWLSDPAVRKRALFHSLCWPGDELARYVLRPERPLTAPELDAFEREPVATAWTRHEAPLVNRRIRHGLDERRLLRLADGAFDAEGIEDLLGRVRECLPFGPIAKTLLRALAARASAPDLAASGLWKRAVFEYAVRQELPHRQIVERAGPPAEIGGHRLDAALLGNWLSVGRLFSQLAAHVAARGER